MAQADQEKDAEELFCTIAHKHVLSILELLPFSCKIVNVSESDMKLVDLGAVERKLNPSNVENEAEGKPRRIRGKR
jgi:hypothetical protein